MVDASSKMKIDRSHRIGKKRVGNNRPRPIVVKFNYHQDREFVRINAKKLKGTKIEYPEEIESTHKTLYPELKKAKAAGKKGIIIRGKLIIEGRVSRQYNTLKLDTFNFIHIHVQNIVSIRLNKQTQTKNLKCIHFKIMKTKSVVLALK